MQNRRHLLLSALAASVAAGPAIRGPAAHAQPGTAAAVRITGAGATFPNPLYQSWGEAAREAIGVQLNYQSIGSGAGQNQIRNRTVDFGASDAPLPPERLARHELLQFPTVLGSLVPVVNLPDIGNAQLSLTGPLLADIFLGKVARWNDPRIAELNHGVALPGLAIAPVHRADGSGTTFVWASYLAAVSPEWAQRAGIGTSVRFPAGTGARGNEGVAGTVRNTSGAIGYVENAYALQNRLAATRLRNRAGRFVTPSMESFRAAAASADWSAPGFAANLIDQGGADSWPIVAPTFILLPANPQDPARSRAVLRFFDWAFRHGDALATRLEYIPVPDEVADAVRRAWATQVKGPDGRAVWIES